jgi:1-acyl-sn-glycerol-3-phosphate acyltransferase
MYSDVSDDEERFEFGKGIIRLSQQFKVPILPIAIKGMNKVLPLNEAKIDWGDIVLSVGKPSSYFSSPKELKEEVQRLYSRIS